MRRIPTVSVFLLRVHALVLVLVLVLVLSGCGSTSPEDTDIPVTTDESDARAFFLQGRDAYDVERREDASALFDKAIAADTTFALAYLYRAMVAETPEEVRHFTTLASRHSSSASEGEQLLIAMQSAVVQGDLAARNSVARLLRQRFPRGPRALYVCAMVEAENKNPYEERSLLEAALDLNGLFAPALRAIVNSYLFEDPRDEREAERHAQRYVQFYPEEADAHILLGDVYRAGMRLEEARGEYTRATVLARDSYLAYIKRGHALTFIGLYADARKDYARATELGVGAGKAVAANYRTFTWLYAQDLATAIEENAAVLHTLPLLGFDEASDFQPYYNTWYYRFRMCMEAGKFDEAEKALAACARFARALAKQAENQNFFRTTESEIALLEGQLALARGEIVAARGHTDRSVDFLRPIRSARKWENTELLKGQIELAENRPGAALDHLNEANQDLIQVRYYRAVALDALGRRSEAQHLFRDVANWHFNDVEYAIIRHKASARVVD